MKHISKHCSNKQIWWQIVSNDVIPKGFETKLLSKNVGLAENYYYMATY